MPSLGAVRDALRPNTLHARTRQLVYFGSESPSDMVTTKGRNTLFISYLLI
jgi:hypothetical protein